MFERLRKIGLTATLLFLVSPLALAAGRNGFFTYAPYGHSLYSDMHPNFVRLDVAYMSNHAAYDFGRHSQRYRWNTLGCFGVNLPVWQGDWRERNFGLSITWTMSAQIWLDLFEPLTSPIVNTDYRISLPTATFIHRVDKGFVRNYSIALSPYKHESTHIGDELQIQHRDEGYALSRVNVSYNYSELAVTLNEPEDRMQQNHTFRLGLILLHAPRDGWYSVKEDAGDGDPAYAHPRLSPWEAYLQYQYQSPSSRHGIQGIASAEVRNRAVYGYDLTLRQGAIETDPVPDYRRFTYSLFVGMRYNIPHYDGYFSRYALGLRAYYGNCPYGQFRNIDGYCQWSFTLIFL